MMHVLRLVRTNIPSGLAILVLRAYLTQTQRQRIGPSAIKFRDAGNLRCPRYTPAQG